MKTPADPREAIGVWAWRTMPAFAAVVALVFHLTVRNREDLRLPLALKSVQDDWFVVETLTGKRP